MNVDTIKPLIVVIGGAGYIGSWCVRELLTQGFRVRVFDNFLFGGEGLMGLSHIDLEIIRGDICDVNAVSSSIKGADCVIMLAALVGRRFEDIEHAPYRNVNFLATSVVLDAAIEHGVSRYVFASTDSVYGAQSGVMYETATPEPVSLYSRLKLRMEERVIRAKSRYFHPTALRIATCHGFSPRMRFDLVPNTLARDAFCKGSIKVQTRQSCRAFIHVHDVALAITACVKAHENLISGEIFNVGSNEQNATVEEIALAISAICPEAKLELNNDEPDLVDYRLSCSKIAKLLDFTPRWTIDRSLAHLLELLREERFPDPYSLRYQNT